MDTPKNQKLGILLAIGAQLIWGCFPIYLDFLRSIPAQNIVVHRTIWSFLTLLGVMLATSFLPLPKFLKPSEVREAFQSKKVFLLCLAAAAMIAINWIMFVWASNSDHKVDASLGYYICPQVLVLLGVVILGERLNWQQWIAVAIVTVGVFVCGMSGSGEVWISLTIACSFGLYAFCKKQFKLTALGGLTVETGLLSILAILFSVYVLASNKALFSPLWWQNVLLVGTGVATIAPLALYAAALKHISLSVMGFLQFIGPTLQLIIGYLSKESVDATRWLGFSIVWIGVILFLIALKKNPAPAETSDSGRNS